MPNKVILLAFAVSFTLPAMASNPPADHYFSWNPLPPLPLAGALSGSFAGESNGVAIIAGGQKVGLGSSDPVFTDQVFIFRAGSSHAQAWEKASPLPEAKAAGSSVTTPMGVLCIGGRSPLGTSREVCLIKWNLNTEQLEKRAFPPLPLSLEGISSTYFRNTVHVAGLEESTGKPFLFVLDWNGDLTDPESGLGEGWLRETVPVDYAGHVTIAVQSDGERFALYWFSGKGGDPQETEVFRKTPISPGGRWQSMGIIPWDLSGSSAIQWGQTHVLFAGALPAAAEDNNAKGGVLASFHTTTNTWVALSKLPSLLHPPSAFPWRNGLLLVGGLMEESGVSSAAFFAEPRKSNRWVGWADYSVICAYMIFILGLGLFFSKQNKGTSDFLLAGRNIPSWAAALSLLATGVSSIGFIAVPAKSFATDWVYLSGILTWFIVVPIVTIFYIPLLRKLDVTTAYEYLEHRFNLGIRMLAAFFFLVMQTGRMAVVLYLPALVLSSVIALDIKTCILIMGCISIVYTYYGGMAAVVWTDVLQVLILYAGAVLCICLAISGAEGGLTTAWSVVTEDRKMNLVNPGWSYAGAVFWVVIVGNIFNRLSTLTSEQQIVQRYLITRDAKAAVRAQWGDVALSILWALIAFLMGTALYVFYKSNPELLQPGMTTDLVVPLFIAQQLPAGIAGLIIAAIFSAAMSSLDSSMHSMSTVCIRDFYGRLFPTATDARQFTGARWLTIAFGVVGTGTALLLAKYPVKSLWDLFIGFVGLIMGSLAGLFLLGLFSKKATGHGALIGAVLSAAIVIFVARGTDVHFFLYPAVGVVSCMILGYLGSLLLTCFGRPTSHLAQFGEQNK